MASFISHGIASISIRTAFPRSKIHWRILAIGVILSVVPDFDAIGFYLGVPYGSFFGHRGFTHSFFFAGILAVAGVELLPATLSANERSLTLLYFFLAAASHGILDAMTNGGMGIAFFSPISNARYFLPWRPIQVAPLHILDFFSDWGMQVLVSELKWVWLPSVGFAALAYLSWRMKVKREVKATDSSY